MSDPECKHGWSLFNPTPCAHCAAAADAGPENETVTEPVTGDEAPSDIDHLLDIPALLKRNADGSFTHKWDGRQNKWVDKSIKVPPEHTSEDVS